MGSPIEQGSKTLLRCLFKFPELFCGNTKGEKRQTLAQKIRTDIEL